MFRQTELEYQHDRIRTEEELARHAALPKISDIHETLAEHYRERRREQQVALGIKLRQRYPARLRHAHS